MCTRKIILESYSCSLFFKLCIFLLFFCNSYYSFSQQVHPYKNGYTYLLIRYDSNYDHTVSTFILPVTAIKDTINPNSDTSVWFNRTVNRFSSYGTGCSKKDLASNLGYSFNTNSAGNFFYTVNQTKDTILFHPRDSVGSWWTCFQNRKSNLIIKAGITYKKTDTIFGETDTFITFTYLCYDTNSVLLPAHPYNLRQTVFALNHGFIKSFDFRYFPSLLSNFKLVGRMKNDLTERVGITGIYGYQIGDMNVGDVVEEKYTNFQLLDGSLPPLHEESSSIYTIRKVISRVEDTSQIILKSNRQRWYKGSVSYFASQNTGSVISSKWDSVSTDTLKVVIKKAPGFIVAIMMDNVEDLVSYNETIGSYSHWIWNGYNYHGLIKTSDTCWVPPMNDPSPLPETYYESGIGSGYYTPFSSTFGFHQETSFLPQYYKKGNYKWGTPYPFMLGVSEKEKNNTDFNIFPNPFNEKLNIKSESPSTISIYNTEGKLILQKEILGNEILNTETFVKGFYFIEMRSENEMKHLKIFKE